MCSRSWTPAGAAGRSRLSTASRCSASPGCPCGGRSSRSTRCATSCTSRCRRPAPTSSCTSSSPTCTRRCWSATASAGRSASSTGSPATASRPTTSATTHWWTANRASRSCAGRSRPRRAKRRSPTLVVESLLDGLSGYSRIEPRAFTAPLTPMNEPIQNARSITHFVLPLPAMKRVALVPVSQRNEAAAEAAFESLLRATTSGIPASRPPRRSATRGRAARRRSRSGSRPRAG